MLVDENNTNILPFLCESLECILYRGVLRLLINDKEIPLRVRWLCDMPYTSKKQTCDRAVVLSA